MNILKEETGKKKEDLQHCFNVALLKMPKTMLDYCGNLDGIKKNNKQQDILMRYHFESTEDILKVSVSGRLVASCSEEFKETMFERLKDFKKILFNLGEMEHIDSSGLGAIVSILRWKNTDGGVIKLCCLQPRPRIVFDITKVCRIFDIYNTEEEAVAAFSETV